MYMPLPEVPPPVHWDGGRTAVADVCGLPSNLHQSQSLFVPCKLHKRFFIQQVLKDQTSPVQTAAWNGSLLACVRAVAKTGWSLLVFFQNWDCAMQTSPTPLTCISVLRLISRASKGSLKIMFLLNTKRTPQIPQTISVFLNTDIQKSVLDVPNPPSAAFPWRQPSPGCPDILSCASRSAVPPCTRGKHTVHSTCAAGVVKIYSRRKSGGDWLYEFMTTATHVSHCHGWGVTLDSSLWLWGNQWHTSCWGGGERWCFIWVIALAEGLLFSQLCTAMDMATVCLGIVSQCWLFSCTAMRSRGWALPLNFPSFPGIIFYL